MPASEHLSSAEVTTERFAFFGDGSDSAYTSFYFGDDVVKAFYFCLLELESVNCGVFFRDSNLTETVFESPLKKRFARYGL